MSDPNIIRQKYLTSLAWILTTSPEIKAAINRSVSWSDESGYLRDINSLIAEEQAKFTLAAQRLQALGYMTADEAAGSRPTLHVTIADHRQKSHPPLPAFPPLDPSQKVTISFSE